MYQNFRAQHTYICHLYPLLGPFRQGASCLKVDLVAAAGARLAEGVKLIRPIDHRAHHIAARAEQRHLPARTFLEIICQAPQGSEMCGVRVTQTSAQVWEHLDGMDSGAPEGSTATRGFRDEFSSRLCSRDS